ncbi:hypothetical protein [Rhizohabitans arisaemae]|uniref:hypothetical protein n=1 Tax=Rhizohabitans arisaemae TaxID=2720610 RepID=UPI0024B27471|nr:hypothetical protein [Rhizohabitans arisaemae]
MTEPHDEYGERLRRALRAEVDPIVPSAEGLEIIRTRIERGRPFRWWRPMFSLAAALVVAGAVVMAVPELRERVTQQDEISLAQNRTRPPDKSGTTRPEPTRVLPLPGPTKAVPPPGTAPPSSPPPTAKPTPTPSPCPPTASPTQVDPASDHPEPVPTETCGASPEPETETPDPSASPSPSAGPTPSASAPGCGDASCPTPEKSPKPVQTLTEIPPSAPAT